MINQHRTTHPLRIKTAIQLFFIIATLFALTACAQEPLTPEDMIYADVSFKVSEDTEDLTLVSSSREVEKLTGYLDALLLSQPVDAAITPDLNYHLDLRTSEALHTYTLSFNLANRQALAINETGSYTIPFEWLNDYLTDLPIENHFGHLAPPTFELYIENIVDATSSTDSTSSADSTSTTNDTDSDSSLTTNNDAADASPTSDNATYMAHSNEPHKIALSMKQQWSLQPTLEVGYPSEQTIDSTEVLLRDNFDFKLYGEFSHNGPTTYSVQIIDNKVTDVTANASDSDDTANSSASHIAGSTSIDELPIPEQPGNYTYRIICEWTEPEKGYQGSILYSFDLNIEQPEAYSVNGDLFAPGDCIAILVENATDLDYRVETPTFTKTIALFYYDDKPDLVSSSNPRDLVGLIPIDSRTTPGDYEVKLYKDSTDELLETFAYTLTKKEFKSQQLTVSTSTASLKSNNNYDLDREKFAHAKSYSVGEKLWDGPFLIPLESYRVSTEYATIRYVNGSTTESSRHNAIDLAAPEGTPIMATNNGIVTFADDLIISGNVVTIDHGYGLFSSHLHMYKIYVEEGQEVTKGEIIGEVGTTGYSTGPHLHWSLSKNGVFVNPWTFVDHDPLADF